MNNWWTLAILSGTGLASRNVLLKIANAKIDPALSALVLSVTMAMASIAYMIANRIYQSRLETAVDTVAVNPAWSFQGILPAMLAGIGLAAANILLVYSYKAGGSAALVGIIQTIFSVGITLVIGVAFLNEIIRPLQLVGGGIALAGLALIIKG